MSTPQRTRGIKILKAVSSPIRMHILNHLYDNGPQTYTELMQILKLKPSRDAGRFAYHLKALLKTDLIESDPEVKKYVLTDLGKMVIDVAERVEKRARRPKRILIRASRLALEEFDIHKITNSLIKEAKMPPELAQDIARETEKRLLKSKTKFITAPLIREMANTILIEKGHEEYRHQLTRLGLPVHEITTLIQAKPRYRQNPNCILETAATAVLQEYTLLKALPRDIADAHLSGAIHIHNLDKWLLKLTEVIHDPRPFYQNGLNASIPMPPPENLQDALNLTLNLVLHSARETEEDQTLEYFNVFLAPYATEADPTAAKRALRHFLQNLNQHANTTIALELTTPEHVMNKPAIGPNGNQRGTYKDYTEQAQALVAQILETLAKQPATQPLQNPKIIIKTGPPAQEDEKPKNLLLKAHTLSLQNHPIYFATNTQAEGPTAYTGSGLHFKADHTGDWTIDTVRTANIGTVSINLPRIAYESQDETKFVQILRERAEQATRALEIKYAALKRHGGKTIPFLTQPIDGDQYIRLDSSLRTIALTGPRETSEALQDKTKPPALEENIAKSLQESGFKTTKRQTKRLVTAILQNTQASERLARLDVEKYGLGKVKISGTRDRPYYTTCRHAQLQKGQIITHASPLQEKINSISLGGNLTVVELGTITTPEELLSTTTEIAKRQFDFVTYNQKMAFCSHCNKSWFGTIPKCPECNAVSTLSTHDRFS